MSILNVNAGLSGSMMQSLNTISSVNRLASDSIARINSGLKFNHISDAPATVLQAQGLQSDMNNYSSGVQNNDYTLGQLEGVLSAQDSIASSLTEMASIMDEYSAETDTDAKAVLAEEYKALALGIDVYAGGATYKDSAVLNGGSTATEKAFGTGGSVSIAFSNLTLAGLSLSGTGDITADSAALIKTAIKSVGQNSASLSGYKKLFEGANSIMADSNTAWGQSYNSLVKVNDAEESALLTSLSNQAAAANAALSYQAQFYNISSGTSFTA